MRKASLFLSVVVLQAMIAGKTMGWDDVSTPHILITVLIDTSGSMASDARLETAKREIISKARELIPSPNSPWIIVPFDSQVRSARRFTNGVEELDTYVNSLNPGGGTNIASALDFAHEGFSRSQNVPHLLCFFYSDGEDTRPEDVNAATDRLDKIFAQRVDQGLSQSLVLRRWSSANSDLVTRLKKGGHVDVIDAGEAQLQHVTLEPQIRLVERTWMPAPTLRVLLEAEVVIKGQAQSSIGGPLQITCSTSGVQLAPAAITPGGGPCALELVLQIDLTSVPKTIDLTFDISTPPAALPTNSGVLIATLARDRLVITIDVPPLLRKTSLSCSAAVAAPPQWVDPLTWSSEVLIDVAVTAANDLSTVPYRQPVTFEFTGDANLALIGDTTIVIDRPGTYSREIRGKTTLQKCTTVMLSLAPTGPIDLDQVFEPIPLVLPIDIAPPPPVTAQITAVIENQLPAQWLDLRTGSVLQQANLSIKADHPLSPESSVRLVTQSEAITRRLSQNSIAKPIQLSLAVMPQDGPKPFQMPFEVHVEPSQQGGLHVGGPTSVLLTITPPPPARLALATPSGVAHRIDIPIKDWIENPTFTLTPVVLGIADKRVADGLQAELHVSSPMKRPHQKPISLFQSTQIQLALNTGHHPEPIFRDAVIESVLHATISPASSRIQDVDLVVFVRREAIAKRYLMMTLATAFIVLLVYLPWRFVTQLNDTTVSAE